MEVPQKINTRPTYDLVIQSLSINSKEIKSVCERDICTPVFIVAIFTRAKRQKQFQCLSLSKDKIMWFIYATV
jgi:hypothetical protein